MSRTILALAILLAPALAGATPQQANPSSWRHASGGPFYGRSDGIFYGKTNMVPRLIGNGDGYDPLGPTYSEAFSYGDGVGVLCEAVPQVGSLGFSVAASANQACATTCGNSACVMGFEASLDAANDLLACSDATADGCLCQTTSLDTPLKQCGANWEAPALGITRIVTAYGLKIGHVALLAEDIGPDMDATGLDIAGDATNNDGVELFTGMYGTSGRPMYPSFDPAFQFCATIKISDVSGTDTLWVGFRSAETPNATFANYDTYAAIGVISGDVKITTEDDAGGATTTDTTIDVADAGTAALCVKVGDTGAVTYTVGGSAPPTTAAFTLDAGEAVIPFIHLLHDSDVADEVTVQLMELSYP